VGVVKLLLARGADPCARSADSLRWTSWTFAKQAGHGRVLLELRRAGGAILELPSSRATATQRRGKLREGLLSLSLWFSSWDRAGEWQVGTFLVERRVKSEVLRRLAGALELIEQSLPGRLRLVRAATPRIWVLPGYPTRGAYLKAVKACVLDAGFVTAPETTSEAIAGTIIHESVHARLRRFDYEATAELRARMERICFENQLDFLRRVDGPIGEVERADAFARIDPTYWTTEAMAERNLEFLKTLGAPGRLMIFAKRLLFQSYNPVYQCVGPAGSAARGTNAK
jgi:hypothetical protein